MKWTFAESSSSDMPRTRSPNSRCAFSSVASSSSHDSGGGGGVLPAGIPFANASLNTAVARLRSSTKVQARSRAVLLRGCGLKSSLSGGYARRTFIVVSCSRSYVSRKCSLVTACTRSAHAGYVAVVLMLPPDQKRWSQVTLQVTSMGPRGRGCNGPARIAPGQVDAELLAGGWQRVQRGGASARADTDGRDGRGQRELAACIVRRRPLDAQAGGQDDEVHARRGSARSAGDAFRGPLGFASPPEATSTRPDPALCPSFPRPLCTSGARAWKTPGTSGGKPPVARGLKLLQTGKRWRRCALRKRARSGNRRS